MIHLITGNTGSGKTTYAKKIKLENNGVIFSIDKWNKELFFPDKKETDGLEWFLERIERVENLIFNLIEQLEASDIDSILDLGLAKFEHREKFRNLAKQKGFATRLHFLDISREIRMQRVLKRNIVKGETFEFEVTKENFNFMDTWFEVPDENELQNAVIIVV